MGIAFKQPSNYGVRNLTRILEACDKIVFSLRPGNDTNLQGGATQSEQGNGTENGHNGGTQTRRNNELQNGHGGETRTSTEPDNGTQNGHGGETCTSTEPDNGTQNGHGGETRTSTEPDNGTQNGHGGETRTSTELDNGTQNGEGGETHTSTEPENRTTKHKTDRVARHGLYKIMQYKTLNQGQEGKKPIKIDNTCRNPEVALRLRRRKLHENEK